MRTYYNLNLPIAQFIHPSIIFTRVNIQGVFFIFRFIFLLLEIFYFLFRHLHVKQCIYYENELSIYIYLLIAR